MTLRKSCRGTAIAEHGARDLPSDITMEVAMKKLSLLLSVLVPLGLLTPPAEAKKEKKFRVAQFEAGSFVNSTPVLTAALKRFVINPHGEVDGLLFEDGTLARFPPHMAADLPAAVKPGDPGSVRGFREPPGTLKALVITNAVTRHSG